MKWWQYNDHSTFLYSHVIFGLSTVAPWWSPTSTAKALPPASCTEATGHALHCVDFRGKDFRRRAHSDMLDIAAFLQDPPHGVC